MSTRFTVPLGGVEAVTALAYTDRAATRVEATLVLGHGAGAGQTSPFMVSFAAGLAARGLDVITFNFLYAEQGRRAPDRGPRLEACYRAVVETARAGRPEVAASPLRSPPQPRTTTTRPRVLGWMSPASSCSAIRCTHPAGRTGCVTPISAGSGYRCWWCKGRGTASAPRTSCDLCWLVCAEPTSTSSRGATTRSPSAASPPPPREEIYATVMDEIVRWTRNVLR